MRGREICLGVASFTNELRSGRMNIFEFLQIAQRLDFRWVELCDRTVKPNDLSFISKLREECEVLGLRIAAIDVRNDFTSPSLKDRADAVQHVKDWIDVCAVLSVPTTRVWAGRSSAEDGAVRRALQGFNLVTQYAASKRVQLAFENHGGISENPDMVVRMVHWVNSRWFGTCPDFGWLADGDRLSGLAKLIPLALHMHAKSHRFDETGCEPKIDFGAIGNICVRSGYSGFISVEYEGSGSVEERLAGVEATAALVRRYFGLCGSAVIDPTRKTCRSPVQPDCRVPVGGQAAPHIAVPRADREAQPYIQRIAGRNIWKDARPVILKLVHDYAARPETIGIVILGGLADRDRRRFVDQHSDLDLAIFLSLPGAHDYNCPKQFVRENSAAIPSWLPPFQFFVDVGGTAMEVNCHQLIMEIETRPNRTWPASKQEAYLDTGEIVFDRDGSVERLIRAKCFPTPAAEDVIVLASQLPWHGWINPTRQLDRGFPINGRMLLNQAIEILLKLVFAANRRHWPHLKWQYEMARDLTWLPSQFEDRLTAVLGAGVAPSEIKEAIYTIRSLGEDVLERLVDFAIVPPDSFGYASVHIDVDRQLSSHKSPYGPSGEALAEDVFHGH